MRFGVSILLAVGWLASLPAIARAVSPRSARISQASGASSQTVKKTNTSGASSQASHFVSTKKKNSSRRKSSRDRGQKAPTSDRIGEIQSSLARGGYYTGAQSGKFDSGTQDALRRFQEANGLNPSGKLDAHTLQKLGLGSDTAGVAAPRATPPPANPPNL